LRDDMTIPMLDFDVPPYRLSGTVYGALLNDPRQIAALGDAARLAPYKAPPAHPVLAVKPRNTLAGDGAAVVVPAGAAALELGATLAIVIGRAACRIQEDAAMGVVAGYTIVDDISVPLADTTRHYRPAVRFRARDGFCPIGPRVTPADDVRDPDALRVRVLVDGVLAHESSTAARTRGVARLIADVSEFMTLRPGDLLLLGAAHGAPLARAGQSVAIEIEGLGRLTHRLVAEEARA
jgi:5-oxopent-3-ene-1,2,5-tricarboxylate decarboxylase / 2-hydroxyhepta-2,4-diene-1,7-dioate isomerase